MKKALLFLALSYVVGGYAQTPTFTEKFDVRSLNLDFRTQTMTIEAAKEVVDRAAKQGLNAVLVEWEATFPFEKHATLSNKHAFTKEQIKDFVAYSNSKGVDVIPLQNCFGHCEYILRHERYWALREDAKDPSQVCPLKVEAAIPVFEEIFREVAQMHTSQYFHIGADETYLLGDCKQCSDVAARHGKSRLFVDYIKAMSQIVIKMGKTPVIWADIILKYPEAVTELPKELIFVDWNYGWSPDKFGDLTNLFKTGVKMWGAPALRSGPDNLYLVQWKKHFENLAVFVPFARKNGYKGMIDTSWSTSGTYGYHIDAGYEVINMQPVRQVYPMKAFNILIDAFARAVNQVEPLDPQKFVVQYAKEKYGFNNADAEQLWSYFAMPQELIRVTASGTKDGRGKAINDVIAEAVNMRDKLSNLSPKSNKQEFDQYVLMLDIRINYLKYKAVEGQYQSSSYTRAQAAPLASQLKGILSESDKLDAAFRNTMKGYLKDAEIEYLINCRSEKMKWLYESMNNNK